MKKMMMFWIALIAILITSCGPGGGGNGENPDVDSDPYATCKESLDPSKYFAVLTCKPDQDVCELSIKDRTGDDKKFNGIKLTVPKGVVDRETGFFITRSFETGVPSGYNTYLDLPGIEVRVVDMNNPFSSTDCARTEVVLKDDTMALFFPGFGTIFHNKSGKPIPPNQEGGFSSRIVEDGTEAKQVGSFSSYLLYSKGITGDVLVKLNDDNTATFDLSNVKYEDQGDKVIYEKLGFTINNGEIEIVQDPENPHKYTTKSALAIGKNTLKYRVSGLNIQANPDDVMNGELEVNVPNPCDSFECGKGTCNLSNEKPQCSCEDGYEVDADGKCVDANECSNANACKSGFECQNTEGSFVCNDVDECDKNTDNCGTGFTCENTEGSFLCNDVDECLNPDTCGTGYSCNNLSGSHECVDVDECQDLDICESGFECKNIPGNYTCEDVNECETNVCGTGYTCSNTNGSYGCSDIDECSGENNCNENATCSNTDGGFSCSCSTGYEGNGVVCSDIDDCKADSCYAGVTCTDKVAPEIGFTCGDCPTGYSGDGVTCTNINECEDSSTCGSGFTCEDTQGSFECKDVDECEDSSICESGFVCKNIPGDYTCEDVDECETDVCGTGYTCSNTNGSYGCSDTDDCKADSCYAGVSCMDKTAPEVGFTCGDCPTGYTGDGVTCTPVNNAPTFKSDPVANPNLINSDTPTTITVEAEDIDGDNITVSLTFNGDNLGCTFDQDSKVIAGGNGTVTFTMTPEFGTRGNAHIIVTISDGKEEKEEDKKTYQIDIGIE